MSLTILNNISSLTAENALSNTQANLQHTLGQLSTGLKINSGADDAAGLSIANGMQANIAALTQSQQNANNGIGLLQTADGALSQVTTLLNRATTLATEASNGGITGSQATALNTEYQNILTEINQIGNTTNFNGQNVFSSNSPNDFTSAQGTAGSPLSATTALTAGDTFKITDSATGGTMVYTAAAGDTLANLATAITNAKTAGTLDTNVALSYNAGGQLEIKTSTAGASLQISSTASATGAMSAVASNNTATVYLGDGVTTGAANTQISTTINTLSSTGLNLGVGANGNLSSASNAQAELNKIYTAIGTVAAQRGTIGASINRLTAAASVMSNAVENLQSASNNIENADIGKTVANMTQYNVLQSTGMAALQQSNQAQQAVLKLVQ